MLYEHNLLLQVTTLQMAKLFQKRRINCGYIVNGSFFIVLQCQLPPTPKYSKKKKKV